MRIIIRKRRRSLTVLQGRLVLFRCRVSLGRCPKGAKRREGDGRTPEGTYHICAANPRSKFYRALALTYPNAKDIAYGYRAGWISKQQRDTLLHAKKTPWDTPLGGWIMIHGQRGSQYDPSDWTAGCIALQDPDMLKLFQLIPVGTTVSIRR